MLGPGSMTTINREEETGAQTKTTDTIQHVIYTPPRDSAVDGMRRPPTGAGGVVRVVEAVGGVADGLVLRGEEQPHQHLAHGQEDHAMTGLDRRSSTQEGGAQARRGKRPVSPMTHPWTTPNGRCLNKCYRPRACGLYLCPRLCPSLPIGHGEEDNNAGPDLELTAIALPVCLMGYGGHLCPRQCPSLPGSHGEEEHDLEQRAGQDPVAAQRDGRPEVGRHLEPQVQLLYHTHIQARFIYTRPGDIHARFTHTRRGTYTCKIREAGGGGHTALRAAISTV